MARSPLTLRNRALALLGRREHARAELQQKLLPHATDAQELDALLDDLVARGWLSDARFAESWSHGRAGRYGMARLQAELRGKGVDTAAIDQALTGLGQTEETWARELWRRKFGQPAVDLKSRARQLRFLAARGFSLDVAYKVVGTAVDEEE
ncbi:recombination regulator RecX [Chitiniphilus purpureus]|uniref:Regulatory protein RecX n=1 Tax=Chitiniphilus purpureus TaxID=2981137 RepID=A0ABY6DMG0_9NEIS|nr:recombination regulator RecX [Chitiniphilus sp. CD1]UXY14286.1 recombination regulator RecX [Chitiniphilus sp. CD1]